jgi:putative colanic acid biosynthesis UDP-glucose lipid carrier transferase
MMIEALAQATSPTTSLGLPPSIDLAVAENGVTSSYSDRSPDRLRSIIILMVRLADSIAITGAAVLSYALLQTDISDLNLYYFEVALDILLSVIAFQQLNLYNCGDIGRWKVQLPRIFVAYGGATAALVVFNFLLKISEEISRAWAVTWFLAALVSLLGVRLIAAHITTSLNRAGKFAKPVAIIGTRDAVRYLTARLTPEFGKTIDLVQAFDVGEDCYGALEKLATASRMTCIDEVYIPLPWTHAIPLDALLHRMRNLPLTVKLIPEVPGATVARLPRTEDYLPLIPVLERPLTDFQAAIKRAEDIAISSIALTVMGPLMLLIAVLVKLDSPGPALFRQDRWGFNARRISVLKFRTMQVSSAADTSVKQATRNDSRVTRLGRFLRKTSLDELPQLINVLRGEMSLVGPRPHAVAHNEHYITLIDNYLGRHKVKPGITGLAQVSGYRGLTDTLDKMQNRVKFDLEYIENWSLVLDIKILALTAFVGFTNKNAF